MDYTGDLSKMRVEHTHPVQYYLSMGKEEVSMNNLIGNSIEIEFKGIIHCVACGRTIKKAFGQGFCYPCFMNSPLNSECIINPELCLAHEGKGRDPVWEEENHNKPHIVYLALTAGVKVGVTRSTQIPVRWIDQGAWKTIKLALTPNRYNAGLLEVELKKTMSDKTPWQAMLKNEINESVNLVTEKKRIISDLDSQYSNYLLPEDNEIFIFEYPVNKYPNKVKSINLDKIPEFKKTLWGIRGQYLIFDDNSVINLRKYSGYEITLRFDS
jgi:hypothetical protein